MNNEPQVKPKKSRRYYESVNPGTALMVQLGASSSLRVIVFPSEPNEKDEYPLPQYDVTMVQIGAARVSLTHFTEEELHAFWEGLRLAILHALPTVRMLDKEAHDAYVNGTATRHRFYRRSPVFALKRRLFGRNAEGIQDRFDRVLDLDRNVDARLSPDATGLAASGRSRRALPELDPQGPGTFHGEPQAGRDADLGKSTREPDLHAELPGSEDR